MSNKSTLQSIMTIAFVLLIFAPGLLLLFTGGEARLSGERERALPAFTTDGWLDRTFQKNFETWFSRSYNGRQTAVHAYAAVESLEAAAEYRLLDPLRASARSEDNHAAIQAVIDELTAARSAYAAPAFPEYAINVPKAVNQSPFIGTDNDIVGTDGVLLASVYIEEVFGFTPRYSTVTDGDLESKVRQLASIQERLKERGIAFTVAITPNKAAYYPEYIPQRYLDRHTMPAGYRRPYTRFLALLKNLGVNHVDSATVFAENGLGNSFPITGIHWNSLAAALLAQAVAEDGGRQLGVPARGLKTTGVTAVKGSIDFVRFKQDQDLLESIYSQRPAELARAIVDPYYYEPVTATVNANAKPLNGVWIQGGSFRYNIQNFLNVCGYAKTVVSSSYNELKFERNGSMLAGWEDVLSSVSHVVFEVNEQFVYNMGGSPFWEFDENVKPGDIGDFNIFDSLEAYLRDGDGGAFVENRETSKIIVGDNGTLFERGVLVEFYGTSARYTDVTDVYLAKKVRRFADIEKALRKRGIAFTVLITPSKAAACEEDIPDWYRNRLNMPEGYIRPCKRLLAMLKEKRVTVLDSGAILAKNNISPAYAATASRWNPVASLTVLQKLLAEYTAQTGRRTRNWELEGVKESKKPFEFTTWGRSFTVEQDLLDLLPDNFAYSTQSIRYQVPQVRLVRKNEPNDKNILIHGGAYTNEIFDWSGEHVMGVRQYRHNERRVEDWNELMKVIAFVVLEINEADVYDMDAETRGGDYNFMNELYRYLMNN